MWCPRPPCSVRVSRCALSSQQLERSLHFGIARVERARAFEVLACFGWPARARPKHAPENTKRVRTPDRPSAHVAGAPTRAAPPAQTRRRGGTAARRTALAAPGVVCRGSSLSAPRTRRRVGCRARVTPRRGGSACRLRRKLARAPVSKRRAWRCCAEVGCRSCRARGVVPGSARWAGSACVRLRATQALQGVLRVGFGGCTDRHFSSARRAAVPSATTAVGSSRGGVLK